VEKRGISKHRLITGLIVASWLCVTLYVLGLFNIHGGWPAFLALMFFIMAGGKTDKLKPIFLGGATGLLMAALIVIGVEFLMASIGMGMQTAIYIMVFITVFLLVVLEDLSHTLFNSYAFCYFTVALVPAQQSTLEWSVVLFLGGAFFIAGVIMLSRFAGKMSTNKSKKSENV